MKKICFILSLLTVVCTLYGVNYMMYTGIYGEDCEDNEPSQIYGGTYSEYPKDLVDAEFPGGPVEMTIFLSRNTELQKVYSGEVDKNGDSLLVTGEVLVEFVVDRCGMPGNFRVIQSLTNEQDEEALRVMQSLPMFRTATLNGYRVKSAYVAPIRFIRDKMPKPKEDDYNYYDDYNYDYNNDYNYDYNNDYNYDYNSDYNNDYNNDYNTDYNNTDYNNDYNYDYNYGY